MFSKSNDRKESPPRRIESGIARLDYILKGGLLSGSTYTLLGPPGSGKTILGNQFCFNHARKKDGRSLYVTILSESISKMITHLKGMTFFDESCVPERVYYVSGYTALEREGLSGLLELIESTVRSHRAELLVLDSIEAASDRVSDQLEYKKFVHRLQAFAALVNCTTLLLSARSEETSRYENTTTDGVVELSNTLRGPRGVRELVVHKFRGSGFLPGKHEVEITEKGIQIHPRTEIQFDKPLGSATEKRVRMPFGVESLDRMMEGGPLSGSATALVGAPGTGKTMLGLTFLTEGARRGDRGIYFGFYEPPPRLVEKAGKIGLEFEKYVEKGLIEVIWQPPLEHYMDSLAEQLLEKVKGEDQANRRRLFIDGIEGFRAAAIYSDRVPRFLSAFFNQLRMSDITTVISEELGIFEPEVNVPSPELVHVVESVLLLRYVEMKSQLYRLLSIMKMRESKFDTSIREFKILDSGIEVSDSFRSAEAILTGNARVSPRRDAE